MSAALTPSRVEAGFWLIILVSLAAGIGIETDWGRQMQWPVKQIAELPPEFPKPALAEPYRLPPSDQYPEITARPIFVVTRRPPPTPPPAAPPKPSMKRDQFVLMGTTVVGASKFAFLVEKAGNKSRVVAEGKEINGIMVREIAADRVVLSQYDDTEVLVLMTRKPPPGTPGMPTGAPGAVMPPVLPGGGPLLQPAGAPGAVMPPGLSGGPLPQPAGAPGAPGAVMPPGLSGGPLPQPEGAPGATPPPGRRIMINPAFPVGPQLPPQAAPQL
jgi:hypothetical protein